MYVPVLTKDMRKSEILRNRVEVVVRSPSKATVKTEIKKKGSAEVRVRALTEVSDPVGATLEIARETIGGASLEWERWHMNLTTPMQRKVML